MTRDFSVDQHRFPLISQSQKKGKGKGNGNGKGNGRGRGREKRRRGRGKERERERTRSVSFNFTKIFFAVLAFLDKGLKRLKLFQISIRNRRE